MWPMDPLGLERNPGLQCQPQKNLEDRVPGRLVSGERITPHL